MASKTRNLLNTWAISLLEFYFSNNQVMWHAGSWREGREKGKADLHMLDPEDPEVWSISCLFWYVGLFFSKCWQQCHRPEDTQTHDELIVNLVGYSTSGHLREQVLIRGGDMILHEGMHVTCPSLVTRRICSNSNFVLVYLWEVI